MDSSEERWVYEFRNYEDEDWRRINPSHDQRKVGAYILAAMASAQMMMSRELEAGRPFCVRLVRVK